jgi:molybdopterin molybdotransferase
MSRSFEDARGLILDAVKRLPTETVPLLDALGRALAVDITAPFDLPRFDNSAMDGFAVRSRDCLKPAVTLQVSGYIPAGGRAEPAVATGCAVRIMTGGPIPPDCDAVVPFEETEEKSTEVLIHGKVTARAHIRFRGEDIREQELAMSTGCRLRPAEINMLASFGHAEIPVYRRARVAILSTGDELVELGHPLSTEVIVNSNSWSLAAAVRELGAEPVMLGIARDNHTSLREKLAAGLQYDALITSAGVSAGDRDFVREILTELDVKQLFWKVDIKPGRPTAFGIKGNTPVFSLPGNPVSSMITFDQFVRPALLQMMGHSQTDKPLFMATLKEAIRKKAGRVQFMRVVISNEDGELFASSSGDQNTAIVCTMLRANGLAILPAERDSFAAGERVPVQFI